MAIYSKLSNVRKLTNSSLNAIIDVSNLNFTDISNATLEFLNNISYDESTNSIDKVYELNTKYLNVSNEFTVTLNGVPTWTIDSQGRAEGNSFLVEVAESKRDRHTDFPNWPDEGIPGEVIYTGVQNQKPQFGEDLIGYLDGRGWVSLTQGSGGWNENGAYTTIEDFTAGVPITISHGLGTENIHVQLIDTNTDELIDGEIDTYEKNTVNVTLTADLTDIKIVIISAGGKGGDDGDWVIIGSPGFDLQMGVPGTLLPWADDFNDLGEPTLRWKDIYLGSTIDFLTTLDIDNDGTTIIKVNESGAEFESDFSGSYNNRSIVDKEYVDSMVGGDRGLTYVILAGDLSQAQMDAKIVADAGEATQFLWSQSTSDSNYQTLSLSGIDEMVEIRIINNESLQTVTFNGLLDIWSSMQIGGGTGNPALTTISCPDLLNSWDYVSITENSALTSISFPSLVRANDTSIDYNILLDTLDFSSLQNVTNQLKFDTNAFTTITLPALETVENWLSFEDLFAATDINLPLLERIYGDLTEYNWNFNGLTFKKCDLLTTISAPLLETIDTFLHIERNNSLINISPSSFTDLNAVQGRIYICNNELLETIEFPALVSAGQFSACSGEDGNPSLETINLPMLNEITAKFDSYSTGVNSMTTINVPNLIKVGRIRIRGASLMTDIDIPLLPEIYGLQDMADSEAGFGESWGLFSVNNNPLLENISVPILERCGAMDISYNDSLGMGSPGLSFPALEEILAGVYQWNPAIRYNNNSSTTSLSFPSLKLIERSIEIHSNANLTNVDLSALEEIGDVTYGGSTQIIIYSNPNLTYIDLFSLVSWPASSGPVYLDMTGNKLDTAYIDSILIYFASLSPLIPDVNFNSMGQTPPAPHSGSPAVLNAIVTLEAADWEITTDV